MKKFLFIFLAICLCSNMFGADLVLIKTASSQELKSLSGMEQLTLHYLGNGFVIATKRDEINKDFILLEKNSWTENHSYFLVFADEETNVTYRQEIENSTTILYRTKELLFFKAADQNLPAIVPPTDGSLVRIWNRTATLPGNLLSVSKTPFDLDPFIVARMAEVDTTIMHSNLQHLQDYGTRRCIKPEAVLAQNWIKQVFESYGLSTELFDFTMPYGSSSDNVIATKTGTLYPDEYVIIGGHYDSYTGGTAEPGADDNASGTCGILETARILSPYNFDRTIIFCAFSAEEYGLYGSEAYAAWCDAQNLNILGYLNMDMVGYLNPGDPVHTDIIAPVSAQSLVDFYTSVVNQYLPAFITAPGTLTGGDSDHTSFNNHGFMGIFPFEDSQNYSPYIHTSNDVIGPSVNNFAQVGIFTKAMVAATISLANMVPPQTMVVTGIVTDLNTGLPIGNATIQVLNSPIAPVTTNVSGEYTISIQEGTHDVRISKPGFATIVEEIVVSTVNHVFDFQLQESPAWSFESGAFEPQWTFAGNLPWVITTEMPYEGLYCSRSGSIADNQTSQMSIELYLTSAGTVSFFRKVSSETGYDYLKFYIDNVQLGQWSGILDWEEVNFQVTAGLHVFKWTYSKDANTIGGIDRAWVDYIIFPSIAPIPDPPDIVVTPAQFTKTLTLGSLTGDMLEVANNGELPLNYSAQVIYSGGSTSTVTVYPVNANYNTGSTTSSTKTQTSLVKGYPTTEAGWMKFDVSGIPDGSTINSISFHGYVNATYYPFWNINPVTNDPVTASASVLYNDIIAEANSGYYLYQSEASSYTTGWKVHTLGGNSNANLQAALTQNWFVIGIMDRDNNSSFYIAFDGWNQSNKPYLVIDYTYTPPYSWLTVNGSNITSGTVLPGNNQQIIVGFEADTLPTGTYDANIKIISNDPGEPQVMVPCTLNVVTGTTLNLTVMLEGIYNGSGTMNKAQDGSGNHFTGNTADQITIELHDADNYGTIVHTTGNTDLSTTGTSSVIIPSVYNGTYYLAVRHRSSLETTTAAPVALTGGTVSYDFSTAATQAYGSNLLGIGGVYVIYGGDVNQDGSTDALDLIQVGNAKATGVTGYVSTDLNGDGVVNDADLILLQNNVSTFVMRKQP